MLRFLIIALFIMISAPVMAQDDPLSPSQIENLPFDASRANTPNTNSLIDEIDMSDEVEHVAADQKQAGLPQFDTTTFASQIFWLLVMFVVLYVFFAKSALPKLSKTIEDRRMTIKSDLAQAEKISDNVDKTRTDYELAIANAHNDARNKITNAEAAIRTEQEEKSNDFKIKTMNAVNDLEAQAAKEQQRIMSDLEQTVSDLTAEIIGKLGHIDASTATIQKAVDNHMKSEVLTEKKAA